MSSTKSLLAVAATVLAATVAYAQNIPASPEGKAQAQVGGKYVKKERGTAYEGGKWIEITYGRPILRGRANIFGSGADYGKDLLAGAPIWRAGANVSTRLKTEAPLVIGGKTVAPGEYSVFIELKENNWTFVLSNWAAQTKYDPNNKDALWGAYNYTADKDVVRAPMKSAKNTAAVEQLTWGFVNVTETSGELAIWWDKEFATVPFKMGGGS
ncbi:MAG: DUF2911 domain-containing protein [Vicinamibacterales bacterium]